MKSRYEAAKNVFVDSIDIDDYIELNSSITAYQQLQHSMEKPLKMILLLADPEQVKVSYSTVLERS